MKIRHEKQKRLAGGTLLVVVVLTTILCLSLAAYLTLVNHSSRLTYRSQAWNQLIPISEAGVEDALTQLNVHGSTNLACDGWTVTSDGLYTIQRTIGNATYVVTISNFVAASTNYQPVIESRAYLLSTTLASAPGAFLATVGANTPPTSPYLSRGVRVTLSLKGGFRGLIANTSLSITNSTGVTADSYDSSDPTHSSDGAYDPSKSEDHCVVGTNGRDQGSMEVDDDVKIMGTVGTGSSGVLKLSGATSCIGDKTYESNSSNDGTCQSGHLVTCLNVPLQPVTPPSTAGALPPICASVGGTNNYLLSSGNYQVSSLCLHSNDAVTVTGNSTLYVRGDCSIADAQVTVQTNCSLNLYVDGQFSCTGNASINPTGRPCQFSFCGTASNTSCVVHDNAAIVGTLYSPTACADLDQHASICGAGCFNSVVIQHSASFHYDESLANSSNQYYIVATWDEMTPQEVAALPASVPVTLP